MDELLWSLDGLDDLGGGGWMNRMIGWLDD